MTFFRALKLAAAAAAAAFSCTAGPSATTGPTPLPPGALTTSVVLRGVDYADTSGPPESTLESLPSGAVRLTNVADSGESRRVDWVLPADALPANATILNINARVCGAGSGEFWESYGPNGGFPVEHEGEPPAADGCWHYSGAPGPDTRVEAYAVGASMMTVDRVEYDVTYLP